MIIGASSACGQHPENVCISGCDQRVMNMRNQSQLHRSWRVLSHARSIYTDIPMSCRLHSFHQPTH